MFYTYPIFGQRLLCLTSLPPLSFKIGYLGLCQWSSTHFEDCFETSVDVKILPTNTRTSIINLSFKIQGQLRNTFSSSFLRTENVFSGQISSKAYKSIPGPEAVVSAESAPATLNFCYYSRNIAYPRFLIFLLVEHAQLGISSPSKHFLPHKVQTIVSTNLLTPLKFICDGSLDSPG